MFAFHAMVCTAKQTALCYAENGNKQVPSQQGARSPFVRTESTISHVSPVIDIQSLTTSYPCDSYIDLLLAADLCVDAYLSRPNFPVNSRVCHLLIIALPLIICMFRLYVPHLMCLTHLMVIFVMRVCVPCL